ncbi:metallophosphatase family protein, partial [Candidatus Bathyarchaeota archaeon]|nr:metallophosphatase family protein [Candidatus Bathyarchaeota archaeon]
MNIGLIADVHGNVYGLNACVRDLFKRRVELILCAGDVVGYYPFVNEAISLLMKWNVITILGNHDVYLLQAKNINKTLYKEYAIDWADQVITPENRSY